MNKWIMIYGVIVTIFGLTVFWIVAPTRKLLYDYKLLKILGGILIVFGMIVIGFSFRPLKMISQNAPEPNGNVKAEKLQTEYHQALINMRDYANDNTKYNYWNAEAQLLKNKLNQMNEHN